MKIKELNLINFGKFNNNIINLDSDFILIQGLNEAGKSSICKFIEGMFYGFVKPYLKTLRFNDDYYKYKPWSGGDYQGSIVFEYKGSLIRLYRDFTNRAYKIFDEVTGTDISSKFEGYEASNLSFPGEFFFKCSSDVFVNTIMIGQDNRDINPESTKYISDKISDVITENNDSFSIVKGLNHLIELKNEIGTEKSLKKPLGSMVNKQAILEEKVANGSKLKEEYDSYLQEINSKQKTFISIKENIKVYNDYLKYTEQQKLLKVKKAKDELELEIMTLQKENEKFSNFKNISPSEMMQIEEIQKEIKIIQRNLNQLSRDKKNLFNELKKYRDLIEIENIKIEYRKNLYNNIKGREGNKKLLLLLGGILILSIAANIFVYVNSSNIQKYLLIASAAVLTLFIVSLIRTQYLKKQENELKNTINKEFDVSFDNSNNILNNSFFNGENKEPFSMYERLNGQLQEKDQTIEKLLNEEDYKNEQLYEISLKIQNRTGINVDNFIKNKDRYDEVNYLIKEKSGTIESIKKAYDFSILENEELVEYNNNFQYIENLNLEHASKKSESLIKEISSLEEKKKFVEEEVQKLPEYIEELNWTKKDIEKMKNYIKSIEIAVEQINISHNEVKINYIPRLINFLEKYFSMISKYNLGIKLDEDLNVNFLKNNSGEFRKIDSISKGSSDQLFIGLRIGLTNEIFGEKEILIFDDAFVNFDDDRLLNLLYYLKEISKERQVILFSCQSREKEVLLSGNLEFQLVHL
ncbi:ATP-binding protein [Miniphocaeibacter massiliensis]|uniref:ATP-binding protein n=1 Tax=Miniphocaeibacter massiliensis TaxID=2041841 RepID=UPI000C08A775|nr:AAA family ATPase [Miniphocaeibacter massiliensis]